jgi:hypothetical protein
LFLAARRTNVSAAQISTRMIATTKVAVYPVFARLMVSYAEKLAKAKGVAPPAGFNTDFQPCRRFLDQHG